MAACLVLGYILTLGLVPLGRAMLARWGHLRPNYAGRPVPTSMGIPLVASATIASGAVMALLPDPDASWALAGPCLIVVNAAMLAGVVDDLFGSSESRGITGHATALFKKGIVTTGLLKAGVILVSAAIAIRTAAPALPAPALALDALVVALAANLSNLLDLRPGRAAKAYLVGATALAVATGLRAPALVPVGLAGAILAEIRDDLAERGMLGDAGSNPLGAALGYWLALTTPVAARVAALLALCLVHVYAERHSITAAIERNPFLRFLDALGRR
ncbi:MAG TPA: hypothetical protein GX515_10975 [Firmicutes bacterium]|nr:hypothetical protein [Bacillota bacterium]